MKHTPRIKKNFSSSVRFLFRHMRTLLLWGLGLGFVLVGVVAIWVATLQIPDLSAIENSKVDQSIKIYDRTGQVLLDDLSNNTQRTIVPLTSISPNIQNATIAIEDPNFYEHGGIELRAILRAIFVDATSLSASQGGSTITQQVVKNTVLNRNKTITRKLQEWVLALKMERVLSKKQIIEMYLNQAPYGGSVYGVEAASETFFGVHASDVTIPQAAYLAGLLPAPSFYSPYGNHRTGLEIRKNLVLEKMFEHGYITAAERDEYKKTAVDFLPQKGNSIVAPHFVFYVQQYLEQKYGEEAVRQGGWTVITSLDADLQAKAEEIIQKNAPTNQTNYNASNMGLIAIDPKTGQILSMVGSRNYFDPEIDGNFNVTLAARQPGSAFKPFAYAEAFEKGYTPNTVLFDLPTQFSTNCSIDDHTSRNGCYSPVNYDGDFLGPMTLRDALAQSRNVPAVKVLYLAGMQDTLQLAKAMGISTLTTADQYGLTLVLGGGEVTLLDITSAYGVFAQDGMRHAPVAVLNVQDAQGNVVENNTESAGSQVLPTAIAQKINSVLSDSVARAPLGENDIFSFPGHDVAVKTGTTNDYRDAWTVGYTPNIVLGVWAGNNDNTSMKKKVSGFIVGPTWGAVMRYALTTTEPQSFTQSEDIPATKPILNGVWQTPGTDGALHEILYWVDKKDPTGSSPANPGSDPQFRYWDKPVQDWAAKQNLNQTTPTTSV